MTDKNSEDPRAEIMETHHSMGKLLVGMSAEVLKKLRAQTDWPNTETGPDALDKLARVAGTGAHMQIEAYEHWDEYQRSEGSVSVEEQMGVAALLAESRHSGAIPEGATLEEAVEAVLGAYSEEVGTLEKEVMDLEQEAKTGSS